MTKLREAAAILERDRLGCGLAAASSEEDVRLVIKRSLMAT